MSEIRVGSDESGVWREDAPHLRMHFQWSQITRVTGAKMAGVPHARESLEFDHESGHFLEMTSGASGFYGVVGAVGRQYELDGEWFAAVEGMGVDDPPLVLWQRDDYPSD